ncbi:MAG TPA: hypothetical protein VGW33_08450 [Terriglobia bacterium]|nr:hypothetical protein [Terriglobia bacterium]
MKFRWIALRSFVALFAASSVALPAGSGLAAPEHHHAGGAEASNPAQLGRVNFPTSCAPGVQKSFETGVALLHSFQYEQAESAFTDVAKRDPQCAIAYWGEAMSLWHSLWDHPGAATLKQGWADVERAQAASAKTDRERGYIAAAAAFYQESSSPGALDYADRSEAYSKAMEQVYEQNPKDGEAAAFYSLSLIAMPAKDQEADLANRQKAIAILNKLFASEPDHPGAAHYLIHACDTPELAPQGLAAARAYAKIAPSSPHALHMPAHIFTRLGLWQDSIESNLASAAAAEQLTARHLDGASYELHAMDFLEYAYLQSGQEPEARQVIEKVKSVPGASGADLAGREADFQARYDVELHHWQEAAALTAPRTGRPGWQVTTWWARAIGAARSGDAAGARKDVAKLTGLRTAMDSQYRAYKKAPAFKDVDQQEAEAWLAYAEGKHDDAVKMMRDAAEGEESDGVDSLAMPAREMLGDMLLGLKHPSQALAEYESAIKESPGRFDGLYGAAQSAELAGDSPTAKAYYAKLVQVCDHAAAADRPELREAKAFLAQK